MPCRGLSCVPLLGCLLSALFACDRDAPQPTGTSPDDPAARVPSSTTPGVQESAKSKGPAHPHVVLISVDTLRRDHLPSYGYARTTAPNFEQLGKRGVVFDDAVSVQTMTGPAHATMFTGLYPEQHGMRENGPPLDDSVPTLAEQLHRAGYHTGGFISGWTLSRHTRLQRGFDVYDADVPHIRESFLTVRAAIAWLDRVRAGAEAKRPFFLFVHLFDPHYPYEPRPEYPQRLAPELSGFDRPLTPKLPGLITLDKQLDTRRQEYLARYDGEILQADLLVGNLLGALAKHGVLDDTLLFYLSDHGETLFERPWIADHGARVHDEQIRIPLVMVLPGGASAGTRVDAPVHHVDLLPTIRDVAGLEAAPDLPGLSLRTLLDPAKAPPPRPQFSVALSIPSRVPELARPTRSPGFVFSVRHAGHKLIRYPVADGEPPLEQLFDLVADPGEQHDLSGAPPTWAAALRRQLDVWIEAHGSRVPDKVLQPSPEVKERLRALGYVQ